MHVQIFMKDRGPCSYKRMTIGEELRNIGGMKKVFSVRSVSLGVKRELYERVVILRFIYRAETGGKWVKEQHNNDVLELKCVRKRILRVVGHRD